MYLNISFGSQTFIIYLCMPNRQNTKKNAGMNVKWKENNLTVFWKNKLVSSEETNLFFYVKCLT